MKVPNIRTWRPDASDAKMVEDTPMLNTEARESVDMNESNVVGQELINSDSPGKGPLGATGRN